MHSPTLLVLVIATLVSFVAASDCETRSVHHHKKHSKHNQHHTATRSAKHRKAHKKPTKSPVKATTGQTKSAAVVASTGASAKLASVSSSCGGADPSASTTLTGGPNGKESFLNCGLTSGGGWKPPMVTMDMIKTVQLSDATSVFGACTKYQSLFEKYGKKFNIAPVFLASFAMQESSCNPNESGDSGGAFGLMQITSDKCGGAPNGNCADPDYNVMMGAKTFADGLKDANGNVLVALGAYNGWYPGMTKGDATKAASSGCCECQQNLDYLFQFLNGWVVGKDPYSMKLGSFDNLAVCGN